jgi:hypothetical protein
VAGVAIEPQHGVAPDLRAKGAKAFFGIQLRRDGIFPKKTFMTDRDFWLVADSIQHTG